MTITTGTTAVLASGDKVSLLPGARGSMNAVSTQITRHVGQTGTILSGPDSDGDYSVRVDVEGNPVHYCLGEYLAKVTEPAAEPEKVEEFVLGQKYEITADNGGHGFPVGTVVTVTKYHEQASEPRKHAYGTTVEGAQVGDEPTWRYGQSAWVNVADVKPVLAEWERELLGMTPAAPTPEEESALREAREAALAAEKALEDFKAQVRVDLISESYRQGESWIVSIDSWLDELGLPDQYDGMPTTMQTLVLLKGNRVARLAERGESRPWEVKQLSDEGARYVRFFSYQEIKEQFVEVLVEGADEDDDFRDN